jgi:hypothetical protein
VEESVLSLLMLMLLLMLEDGIWKRFMLMPGSTGWSFRTRQRRMEVR